MSSGIHVEQISWQQSVSMLRAADVDNPGEEAPL